MPDSQSSRFVQIQTTIDDRAIAQKMAEELVGKRLVACVQILSGVHSTYRWRDKIEVAKEHLLLIKTIRSRSEQVMDYLQEIHTYDVPEIVMIPYESVSESYGEWIEAVCHLPEYP